MLYCVNLNKKTVKDMNYFKELKVWQKATELVTQIYQITNNFPKEEQFGIISQIRRSAISIPSNIAEGCGRKSTKEFNNFLGIALGSCFELETQLLISKNIGLINEHLFISLESEIQHIQNMIIKLQNSLDR